MISVSLPMTLFSKATRSFGRRLGALAYHPVRFMSGTPGRLVGKVAVVTASTDGIGLAIARRLAQDGAKVMLSSRKRSNVERAVQELTEEGLGDNVKGTRCHVGHPEHRVNLINETLNQFGGIDIFVSNAAVNPHFGPTLDCSEDAWSKIFDVNVKAAFLLTKLVVPHMEKRGGGSIVFVSSIAGFAPITLLGPYSVSKTALLGLTKTLSIELAPDNIRVNSLCPGIVRTKFSNALTQNEDALEHILEKIPLKRVAAPVDMAGTVSFLCSDDATYLTGENIVVAGGMQSKL
ncbi:unnamed protein product [Cyprideis torosa]|uniref:Uncharacterized protein n=1 Tax=Cyprideis torosa TaxID=163714 RepID=A0A7R8WCY6_9CRUS|nr:unnamed protein product [Cyprideis torosa]CAG0894031.1 unnamed protein product [Cyprideis torosa]